MTTLFVVMAVPVMYFVPGGITAALLQVLRATVGICLNRCLERHLSLQVLHPILHAANFVQFEVRHNSLGPVSFVRP